MPIAKRSSKNCLRLDYIILEKPLIKMALFSSCRWLKSHFQMINGSTDRKVVEMTLEIYLKTSRENTTDFYIRYFKQIFTKKMPQS